ncbi:MAG: large-conductance mechanosensitive channel protein MscL [Alphaproteobacteria bacterium]
MLKEFRDFAMRGNVVDLAIGVIIGAAFGNIVNSLVTDIIMPPIGYLTGGIDFAKMAATLAPAHIGPDGKEVPATVIGYGKFINFVITFLIVAWGDVHDRQTDERNAEERSRKNPPIRRRRRTEEKLLTEIRDLLKK